jgi:Ca-activated chloride channel family protein
VTKAENKGSPLRWEGDGPSPLLEVPTGRYDVEARIGFVVVRGSVDAVTGKSAALSLPLDAGLVDLFPEAESKRPEMRDAILTFTRIDEQNSERVAIQRGMVPWTVLLPGTYTVALTHGSLRIERPLVVKAGERTAIDQAFHVGDIELSAVAAPGGPPLEGMIFSVLEDDPDAPQGRREVARSAASHALFTLPAGTYYVVASHGTAEARDRITLHAGETQRKTMTVESGELTVAVRLAGQRGDIAEPISIRLERQGGEAKEVLYASRPTASFEAAAGRYRVETRIGFTNVRAERELDLKAGSREQVVIEHPAGSLKLRLLDRPGGVPVPDVAWDVRDGAGRTVWLGNETEAQPLLLAGRYTVRAQSRERRIEAPVEVRAGEVKAVDLSAQ